MRDKLSKMVNKVRDKSTVINKKLKDYEDFNNAKRTFDFIYSNHTVAHKLSLSWNNNYSAKKNFF